MRLPGGDGGGSQQQHQQQQPQQHNRVGRRPRACSCCSAICCSDSCSARRRTICCSSSSAASGRLGLASATGAPAAGEALQPGLGVDGLGAAAAGAAGRARAVAAAGASDGAAPDGAAAGASRRAAGFCGGALESRSSMRKKDSAAPIAGRRGYRLQLTVASARRSVSRDEPGKNSREKITKTKIITSFETGRRFTEVPTRVWSDA